MLLPLSKQQAKRARRLLGDHVHWKKSDHDLCASIRFFSADGCFPCPNADKPMCYMQNAARRLERLPLLGLKPAGNTIVPRKRRGGPRKKDLAAARRR